MGLFAFVALRTVWAVTGLAALAGGSVCIVIPGAQPFGAWLLTAGTAMEVKAISPPSDPLDAAALVLPA